MYTYKTRNVGFRIALIYLCVGLVYCLFTDYLSHHLIVSPETCDNIHDYKGVVFVAITAILLFYLINRNTRRQNELIDFFNKSEHWYNVFVSNIPNVEICVFDPKERVIITQGDVTTSLGINVEAKLGSNLNKLGLTDSAVKFTREVLKDIFDGKEVEKIYKHENNYLQVHGVGLQHPKDKIFAGLIVLVDVSERYRSITELQTNKDKLEQLNVNYSKQNKVLVRKNEELNALNEQLKKARIKAEESDRLKSSFLTNMSHEIRTPLNGIIGFSQIIASAELSKEEVVEYSKIVSASGEKLLSIIDDILIMSRLDTNQFEFNTRTILLKDLVYLLQDTAQKYIERFEYKNPVLSIEFDESHADLEIFTDPDVLCIVVKRLLDNSLKFSDENPVVTVGCGYDSKINDFEIYVKDNGVGIPRDKFYDIFLRFYQINGSDFSPVPGNGLGLSIVKSLLEGLNHTIYVDSAVGKGSKFVIGNSRSINNRSIGDKFSFSSKELPLAKKILVIEDISDNYILLNAYLKNYNVELCHQATSHGAKRFMANSKDIDLILMDIRLPDGDGIELTRYLRDNNVTCPIIAQTAYADSYDRNACLEAGCSEYLPKPILKKQFLECLSQFVDLEAK